MSLRSDADCIIKEAIHASLPDEAVKQTLSNHTFTSGKLILISVGKAAWQMAHQSSEILKDTITKGIVITKYGHARAPIPPLMICEAGHPVPDYNTFSATKKALELVKGLTANDTVLFLLSGGGSALFEQPLVSEEELSDITNQLLASGANIVEMNTIRKRISNVKGGKFAKFCEPAKVYSIILSDIIGDPLDMIASGPAYPDHSTCDDALRIVQKYQLHLSDHAKNLLTKETPKSLLNVTTILTGSVTKLCEAAKHQCEALGYQTHILSTSLNCEAREAGSFIASIARQYQSTKTSLAFIFGGETVVHLTGTGLGGRNQELALSAALGIRECTNTAIFSVGSDGTDGPTDAAGGYVDETTALQLESLNLSISDVLQQNDAYHALDAIHSLIITGPTGTNVNDLSVLLIRR